jgi:Ca2+-binding RTX toxin-like protein
VLEGGLGRDELVGGSGADIFRFSRVADSYRGANDVIDDFLPAKDVLDLSALGYTGFGDGTEGTVKVAFSSETGRSYVKSLDVDAAGQRFEITLIGDLAGALGTHNFIFDHPAANGWG